MAGALGMILGLGGGSLMAAAGEKHRRDIALEDQARQAMSQMFINHLEQHPELATVENFAKAAKKQFGSAWDTMLPQFQVMAAEQARARNTLMQQLGLQGLPAMAQPGPSMAPSASGGPMPVSPIASGGPGAKPLAAPAQAGGGGLADLAPADRAEIAAILQNSDPQNPATMAQISAIQQRAETRQQRTRALQFQQQMAESRLALEKQSKELEAQRFQLAQQGQQNTEAYRQADLQLKQLSLQMNNAIRQQMAASTEQNRQFMQGMALEREDDARQQHYQGLTNNLTKSREDIIKLASGNSPPDRQSLLALTNGYNTQLKQAKQLARRYKQDDSALPDPLAVKDIPGISIGPLTIGGKSVVAEDAPTPASVKSNLDKENTDIRKSLGLP